MTRSAALALCAVVSAAVACAEADSGGSLTTGGGGSGQDARSPGGGRGGGTATGGTGGTGGSATGGTGGTGGTIGTGGSGGGGGGGTGGGSGTGGTIATGGSGGGGGAGRGGAGGSGTGGSGGTGQGGSAAGGSDGGATGGTGGSGGGIGGTGGTAASGGSGGTGGMAGAGGVGGAASADPLGTATATSAPCGAETCTRLAVRCPGVANAIATVRVRKPTGTVRGTVALFTGASGTDLYDVAFGPATSTGLRAAGFATAEVAWDRPGWLVGPGGVRRLACRSATAARWIYDNVHAGGGASGFCATGNSGGAGQVSYSIAHYGLHAILDLVIPSGGPPFGRIDIGCLCTGNPSVTSPCGPGTPCYRLGGAERLDAAYGDNRCSTRNATYRQAFHTDSVAAPDATLVYPTTPVRLLFGALDTTEAVGLGQLYVDAARAAGNRDITSECIAGALHDLPSSAGGSARIVELMTRECAPH